MARIEIDGIKEVTDTLNGMAREFPRQTIATGLRKATKPFVDDVKNNTPFWGAEKLVRSKLHMDQNPTIGVGVFGKRGKAGKTSSYMSMWYVWYWVDYGTLSNRSRSHVFKHPRKQKSSHWKGGIEAAKTVEKSWTRKDIQVINSIPMHLRTAVRNYMKKKNKQGIAKLEKADL